MFKIVLFFLGWKLYEMIFKIFVIKVYKYIFLDIYIVLYFK